MSADGITEAGAASLTLARLTGMANWSLYNALVRTKELIATEAHWCQGAIALDRHGKPMEPEIFFEDGPPPPCRLCVQGAVHVATYGSESAFREVTAILDDAAGALFPGDAEVWEKVNREGDDPHVAVNDGLGFAAVHQMLDLAIEANKP